jgi:hypothetical protein
MAAYIDINVTNKAERITGTITGLGADIPCGTYAASKPILPPPLIASSSLPRDGQKIVLDSGPLLSVLGGM